MAESAEVVPGVTPGLKGIAGDWSSDQVAFRGAPWGKAMMWIFLLSDTFIFSIFLISLLFFPCLFCPVYFVLLCVFLLRMALCLMTCAL